MEAELLTDTVGDSKGDSDDSESPLFIAKLLDECFPYYLSIGMTYDQYWNDDPNLVKAYRKAEEIRSHRRNVEMWIEGRYVYDGIMRLIPSLNAWKPKEPLPYMDEPYPLSKEESEQRRLREEKRKQDEIKAKMQAFAVAYRNRNEEQKNE